MSRIMFLLLLGAITLVGCNRSIPQLVTLSVSSDTSGELTDAPSAIQTQEDSLQHVNTQASGLTQGDILVVSYNSTNISTDASQFLQSLNRQCGHRNVAICLFDNAKSDFEIDNETNVIFGWSSPYEQPTNHSRTYYFTGEIGCGWGESGLRDAVRRLGNLQPERVLLMGSEYADDRSFSDFELPFDETELTNAIQQACPDTIVLILKYENTVPIPVPPEN